VACIYGWPEPGSNEARVAILDRPRVPDRGYVGARAISGDASINPDNVRRAQNISMKDFIIAHSIILFPYKEVVSKLNLTLRNIGLQTRLYPN
jgi:hypothetical protein